MHRFFLPYKPTKNITIEGDLYHQICHVFRAKKGEEITLFATGSDDMIYQIESIQKNTLTATHLSSLPNKSQAQKNITLFHALPNKISTIETIVEKLTELNIARVVFFRSHRSQHLEISPAKKERINRISQEALEQSGGNQPLVIEYQSNNITTILSEENLIHILATPDGQGDIVAPEVPCGLWIGPEGGWTQEEEEIFNSKGAQKWSFATRILRLETAGIVGAGILGYLIR